VSATQPDASSAAGVLVVDAANVVGSRPDGWWRDRRAATAALRDHLAVLARQGLVLPGAGPAPVHPAVVLVAEGRARGLAPAAGVEVVDAPGEGDETIVDVVAGLAGSAHPGSAHRPTVWVATADRRLRERVRAHGAVPVSPRLVRH
jgi:8-oxo-dGTP diphosphatase